MRCAALVATLFFSPALCSAAPRHGAGRVSAAERRREVRHFCDFSCGSRVDVSCYTQCAAEVQECLAGPDRGGCARGTLARYASFDRNWAQAQSPLMGLCTALHHRHRREAEGALSGEVRRICDSAGHGRCGGIVPACYREARGKLRSWGASTCRGDVRTECKAVQRAQAATRRVHRLLALRAGAAREAHLESAASRRAARSLCDEACAASGESSCYTECETEVYNCNLAHVPPGGEMVPEGEEHEECRREVVARYERYGETPQGETPHDKRSS